MQKTDKLTALLPRSSGRRTINVDRCLLEWNLFQPELASGNMLYVTGNMPYVTGDMPYVTGDMSYVTGNMPYVTGDMPYVTGNMPYVAGNEPFVAQCQYRKMLSRPA